MLKKLGTAVREKAYLHGMNTLSKTKSTLEIAWEGQIRLAVAVVANPRKVYEGDGRGWAWALVEVSLVVEWRAVPIGYASSRFHHITPYFYNI